MPFSGVTMGSSGAKFFLLLLPALLGHAAEEDPELEALKTQAELLSQRIDAYEQKRSGTSDKVYEEERAGYITEDAAGYLPPMQQKGALEMSSADTVLSVGGRIQLHAVYAWPEGAYFAGRIPLDTEGENGQLFMSARDSRLWVKTRTPTEYGPVRTLIEIDFLGTTASEVTTNSHGPRLRHAFLEAAGFTAGQTNSAFNASVTLDTITYAVNSTLTRQPLLRYGSDHQAFGYDLSLEQPETTLTDPYGEIITPNDDVFPDVIARLRYYPEWGEGSVAVMGRYLSQDLAELSDGSMVDGSDAAVGWGVNLSGKFKLWGLDDIRFSAQYGMGLGRYVAFGAYTAGSIDSEGRITLQPTLGANLGYRHWWNQKLRSTLALAYAGKENDEAKVDPDGREKVNEDVYGVQLNLLWMPVPNALIGLEYSNALRRVESGDEGTMDMVTLLVRYDF